MTTSRPSRLRAQFGRLVAAVRNGDDDKVEAAVLQLSRSHRFLAPLAFVVGAFVMLFQGVQLLFSNWRLTLVQVLPAMWIWLAMLDLKVHALHGKSFHVLRGPILIPLILAIAAVTAASFFLNAVFAFAIVNPDTPDIRPAFALALAHRRTVLGSGVVVGIALGVATLVFPRWGDWWFAIALSIVIGVMMVLYVSVPARLIGMKSTASKPEALKAGAVAGLLGATICTPPYLLGRIGLLMLGSSVLFIPGIVLLAVGLTLQAGATGAVKAVKLSSKLLAGSGADTSTVVETRTGPDAEP